MGGKPPPQALKRADAQICFMSDEEIAKSADPPARWDEFLARAEECRSAAERMKSPLIVNHYDCDGITSGSIAAAFFEERKISYRMKTIRKLDSAVLEEIKDEKEIQDGRLQEGMHNNFGICLLCAKHNGER